MLFKKSVLGRPTLKFFYGTFGTNINNNFDGEHAEKKTGFFFQKVSKNRFLICFFFKSLAAAQKICPNCLYSVVGAKWGGGGFKVVTIPFQVPTFFANVRHFCRPLVILEKKEPH